MTTDATTTRSNAEAARQMRIAGWIVLGTGAALALGNNWLYEQLWRTGFGMEFLLSLWSLVLAASFPLGSALVVGAVIVRRLPVRVAQPQAPGPEA